MAKTGRPASCECGVCKRCKHRIYMKSWYDRKTLDQRREWISKRDAETVRKNDAKRFQRHKAKRMAMNAKWAKDHPRETSTHKRTWQARNPEKKRAHGKVRVAVVSGALIKPKKCERCSSEGVRLEGHHNDYSKPLEVEWLCLECHGKTRRRHYQHESSYEEGPNNTNENPVPVPGSPPEAEMGH